MSAPSTLTELDILTDVIRPGQPGFDTDAARAILEMSFNDSARSRMGALVDRGNQGLLTAAEEDELDKWQRVAMFLDLMHSKALLSIEAGGAS